MSLSSWPDKFDQDNSDHDRQDHDVTVEFEGTAYCKAETDKAVLIGIPSSDDCMYEVEEWLPKSQLPDPPKRGDVFEELDMPLWLAMKHGFVEEDD